ncbi:phenylalanine--tRNA ligase subunit beta [Gammaproteobacteria bacterium]|nr:phenylalanine--tRNA ligase subunit beta [Gammaproteobacteria bacterium]
MKIPYQDLINNLSEKPSKELLSDKLFQLGHEHEIHGDIFEMELTPNRGDCLSLLGLSRDLNVFFGSSKTIDIFKGNIDALEIDFENLSPSDCPRISFLEIEIEEQTDIYKPYLENYFSATGNNKTNLFTDISNFISYELGQPTHCFDKDTIKGKLVFENKECNNTFKTLLGSEVKLIDMNCVFSSDNKIVSLAGIMGGISTACTKKTKNVLIECAYFNPESIIGKSIKYNLISDAAHKFERGVDISSHEMVLRRFAKVVQDHVKIKSIKIKSFTEGDIHSTSIPIDVNRINKILGTDLKESEYIKYLRGLKFEIENDIQVPSYRSDIKSQNDLAEEVARVIGYNNIKNLPLILNQVETDEQENKVKLLELFLVQNGFYESVNTPFTSKKASNSIVIDNPLDVNKKNLRTSIKESLIENLLYNERRQKDSIKLFEISDIYTKNLSISQKKKICIIASGRVGNNYKDFSRKIDYRYLDELLNRGLDMGNFNIKEINRDDLDTKKRDKIFYSEINIDDIYSSFFEGISDSSQPINFVRYQQVSAFPSSTRDFSFSITDADQVDEIIELLVSISDPLIKNSFIFDYYKNSDKEIVKLGYRLVFQSNQKTLSDEEINKKIKELITPITDLDCVFIQGM